MAKKKIIRKPKTKVKEVKKDEPMEPKEEVPGPQQPSLAELLSKVLSKKDAKDLELYTVSVIKKFGRYIKSIVLWGSTKTKVKKRKQSDIDIAIIVDDTDVRRMTRAQLKEKLFKDF